jgi:hypothetical protein
VKITIMVEGKTETAFKTHLRAFLQSRLVARMPKLDMFPYDGRIPKEEKLSRAVETLLSQRKSPSDAVIALTDVYTGRQEFENAADAKKKMREWVGPNDKFFPHVAQYDFEAWLLPYWSTIQQIAGHNKNVPSAKPEAVNHNRPPSFYIKEIFRIGNCRGDYSKPRDANRILEGQNLSVAAEQCPELKAFLNTIIKLSGGTPL